MWAILRYIVTPSLPDVSSLTNTLEGGCRSSRLITMAATDDRLDEPATTMQVQVNQSSLHIESPTSNSLCLGFTFHMKEIKLIFRGQPSQIQSHLHEVQ